MPTILTEAFSADFQVWVIMVFYHESTSAQSHRNNSTNRRQTLQVSFDGKRGVCNQVIKTIHSWRFMANFLMIHFYITTATAAALHH